MPKHLDEAGRVLSKKNEALFRAAVASIEEILGALPEAADPTAGAAPTKPGAASAKPDPAAAKAKMVAAAKAMKAAESLQDVAEAMLRQSDSVDGYRQLLRKAIGETMADPMYPEREPYVWLRDIFDEACVYEKDGTLYQRSYTIDKTGDTPRAIVGDAVEVELCYVPVQRQASAVEAATHLDDETEFTESSEIALVEKAVRSDGTATIKLIDPGWGSSGYYPANVLERDGPKVFPAGTKMFANHPTPAEEAQRPERTIEDLVAVLTTGAKWEAAGQDGPGLYAEARVMKGWQADINDLATDIGVSIRALGKARPGEAEGRKGPIIEALVAAKSVDFVTDAGRGGKVLSLREAAAQRHQSTAPAKEEEPMPLSETEGKALQASVATLTESVTTLQTENARLREAQILTEARSFVVANMPKTVPALTQARLIESLSQNPPIKDGALDKAAYATQITEAVKAEVDYLAKVTGSGQVRDMGLAEAVTEPKPEEVQASLTESFKTLGLGDTGAEIAAKGRAQ
jgi:hypothetical protein